MMVVCSVYDTIAGVYGRPVFMPSVASALRSFADEVARGGSENLFAQHPADFDLYHLGMWDDSEGRFELLPHPVCIMRGVNLNGGSDVSK